MSDEQATQQELDVLAQLYALTVEMEQQSPTVDLLAAVHDPLEAAIRRRSWDGVIVVLGDLQARLAETTAVLKASIAAMEAIERDADAQETLISWRDFLARGAEHTDATVA